MEKIALLGVTFDPPHVGHLHVANAVGEKHGLDKVLLLTAGNPPHKAFGVLDAERRHEMVVASVRETQMVEASRFELDFGTSHTVDSVKAFYRAYAEQGKQVRLSFITSAEYLNPDCPGAIVRWKNAPELLSLVDLVVTSRAHLTADLARKWADQLHLENVEIVDLPPLPVTSGTVRNAVKNGQNLRGLVAPEVADIIMTRGYYR